MTATILSVYFGFSQRGQIKEMIFIIVASAVVGVLLEFILKLFIITPTKIHEKYELYVGELEEEKRERESVKPFEVEPICKPNSTNPLTSASCWLHIKNPNQQSLFVKIKLMGINPPMKGPPAQENNNVQWPYGMNPYSSNDLEIEAAGFEFSNCENGIINDGETGKIELFKSFRGRAGTTVVFSGDWKKAGFNNQFKGEGEHIFIVSVSSDGIPTIPTKQYSFKISFSKDMALPVFLVTGA